MRWAEAIEGEMATARYVDRREAERTTLADALRRYRSEFSDHKKGAAQEADRIRRWLEHPLADKSLAAITSSDLAAYAENRKKGTGQSKGVSGTTIRLELAIISHLYTVAAKVWNMGEIGNPVRNMMLPKANKARSRRPTAAEMERLIEAAAEIHAEMPIIMALAADTAMRRSELVNLRRDQIRGRVAYLEDTKNGEQRAVPLSSRAVALFSKLPARIDGRVFSLKPHSVTQYFKRACEAAKVVDLKFHDLRHEATSRLFEKGLPMMEAAAVTGHKTLSQLKRYTHLKPEDIADKLG